MWDLLADWAPMLGAIAVFATLITATHLLTRKKRSAAGKNLVRQLILLALTAVGLVLVIILAPMEPELSGQLLSLMGLAFTAVVALSSQTFVANMMAGLMLRSVRSFKSGDFVRVGDQFGRVTERGLFHTEIQTEDRDLVTLPNLFLVTNPVRVVRASGTVISADLSLGYDVPQDRIFDVLEAAAAEIGLTDVYVHILELGDFSVTYKVAGFLDDVERVITNRSRLRSAVLDALHEADIEIVSPTFMNQRQFKPDARFVPVVERKVAEAEGQPAAEDVGFDKAVQASDIAAMEEELDGLHDELEACKDDEEQQRLEARADELDGRIEAAKNELADKG